MLVSITEKLRSGGELDSPEVGVICEQLFSESVPLEQRADFLSALHEKGETPAEIAAFVTVLLERGNRPQLSAGDILDVCGTGGDHAGFFNVSTAVMFVAAAGGARVVKHGNRGITSRSGGADVLEALGVRIDLPIERAGEALEKAGCCFLFAPLYHPAFAAVAPVRKHLAAQGRTTIFNMLGPLLNPARPAYQLAGVFNEKLLSTYAETFRLLGRRRAWAVHGTGPGGLHLDEMSPLGPNEIFAWENGEVRNFTVLPKELGLPICRADALHGGDAKTNADILSGILSGNIRGPRRNIVLLNAAAALVVAERADDLSSGLDLARSTLDDGSALGVLQRLREVQ